MSKSRGRKIKHRKNAQRAGNSEFGRISFSAFEFGASNHEEWRDAILSQATDNVAALPQLLNELEEIFLTILPESILTIFAFYGSQGAVDREGNIKTLSQNILQHHVELLQALALRVPFERWGTGCPNPDIMQRVFDIIPKISQTFVDARLITRSQLANAQAIAVSSLQEKIRLRTQAVRNWGYYDEVVSICRELYSPLDEKFSQKLGFTTTDFIDISNAILKEIERRASEHLKRLRKVFKARTITEMVSAYYKTLPDVVGSPHELMKLIPEGTPRESVIAILLSHADLCHVDTMTFTSGEINALTGKCETVAQRVLECISLMPGELVDAETMHIFLANPVWTKPAINYGSKFIITLPQAVFSHINEIMLQLATEAGLEEDLTERRSLFLEQKTADVLASALPTARISKNAKWNVGGQQFETDILAFVDRTLLIAEVKSHRLTPTGLRGAPDRLKRHLTDMVVAPSVQSERLSNLLFDAQLGRPDGVAVAAELEIDPEDIDRIIRISITLDDLSVLSSSEGELKALGWVPKDHELAPSLHVADLICIANILENEAFFLHYFSERFYFQKAFELLGDELDFLGLYLSTGFNLGTQRANFQNLVITGLSKPIDRYYEARYVKCDVKKPPVKLHKLYREIIDRVVEAKPAGWSSIAINLLNSASPDEQVQVYKGIHRLKRSVRNNANDLSKECYLEIVPPLNRKGVIGFYLYPENEKANKRKNMEQFGFGALQRDGVNSCVIFGKNIDKWLQPFETVLLCKNT